MPNLRDKKCTACKPGTPTLTEAQQRDLLANLNEWEIVEKHHLSKTFRFKDFVSALAWVNRAGEIAEQEGHHPDIYLTWGKVRIDIWTHAINGLSENDFILAAKFDAALSRKNS